jgi:hypothetical protein
MESARENRPLIGKGGMFGNVIRFTPPPRVSLAWGRAFEPAACFQQALSEKRGQPTCFA